MNIVTQMYDNNMGHGFIPPVNFHLRPDHFHSESEDHHSQRRHTLIGDIHDTITLGAGSRRNSQVSRPKSMALEIPMTLLDLNHRSRSASHVSHTHSTHRTHERSHSSIQDEAMEQLLSETEALVPCNSTSEYLSPSCIEYLPLDHDCQLEGCQRAVINVSGLRFETQLRTLDRLPNTLLGNPEKRRRYWDESRQEFFFDRHRPTFQAVLYYYQSGGRLKRPLEVPMDIFLNELMFYELGGPVIDSFKQNEGYIVEQAAVEGPRNQMMNKIWTVLEYPESSIVAKIFAVVSIFFILVSVVVFCVETLPAFKEIGCVNISWTDEEGRNKTSQRPNFVHPIFLTETCCIAWFIIEMALRLVVSPSKMVFFRSAINWIDLLAIMPYFLFLIINFATGQCQTGHKSSVLSVLRVMRVVRILKLSKHSEGLKILGMTLQTSIRELSMFVLFLGIATIIFSGAIFYAELEHPETQFTSIPDAFWWAIVSMTTVGYGDFVPKGLLGKVLGGVCVLSGVLAIALPVPVIVANFNNYYRHYTETHRVKAEPEWRHRLRQLLTCGKLCTSSGEVKEEEKEEEEEEKEKEKEEEEKEKEKEEGSTSERPGEPGLKTPPSPLITLSPPKQDPTTGINAHNSKTLQQTTSMPTTATPYSRQHQCRQKQDSATDNISAHNSKTLKQTTSMPTTARPYNRQNQC